MARKKFKVLRVSRRRRKKRNFFRNFLIFFVVFLIAFIVPAIAGIIWFKKNILDQLPDVSKIEDIQLAQTSIITDRNWVVLYKIFEQNRKYVSFDKISKHMINAIVATEDKNFWTNPGVDVKWLIRAAIYDVIHLGKAKQWWSTITQQLIKNILLSPEKTITRKLKEIVLAIKLNNYLKQKEAKLYPNLSWQALEKKIKEKILELYLNYIFLGNNSYGVEVASENYFRKSAKDLDVLEAAILASLPKAPSYYDPVKYPRRNLWYFKIVDSSGKIYLVSLWNWQIFSGFSKVPIKDLKPIIEKKFKSKLASTTFTFIKDENSLLDFLKWLLQFDITYKGELYKVYYVAWRKDIVLARMYVDWYIDSEELKKTLIEALNIKIHTPRLEIKAPHFVFYVLDYLKKKYWETLLLKWGLTIKTSLDYNIQKLAEKTLKDNIKHFHKYWANNAALIYLDSKSGDILAYVWSLDYNSWAIDGKVDIIRSLRQPWSTIKPFVYAYAFMKFPFSVDQPIYDTPVDFNGYKPNNVDWRFLWLMPLKKALPYSRNIPAIKLLYIEWLRNFVKFVHSLGVENINESKLSQYWLSLAIWAAEVKMINWARAFSHLSALWKPAKLNPILEIRWADGTIIYKKKIEYEKQIIPSGVAYLIWSILSTKTNFPPSWRSLYTYWKWILFATKSWTTNIKLKNGKSLPRDWWFVAYTPSKVMVFWAWNTKWEPMKRNAYWANLNSPVWKKFVDLLKEKWYLKSEQMNPRGIKSVAVSKLSWKIPSLDTPIALIVDSMAWINNLPTQKDDSIKKIKVDKLCNWKISKYTPESDIIDVYVIKPQDVISPEDNPENYSYVINWWKKEGISKYSKILNAPVFLFTWPSQICEIRKIVAQKWTIKVDIIKPQDGQWVAKNFSVWYNIKSPFEVKKVDFKIWQKIIKSIKYSNVRQITDIQILSLPDTIKWWFKLSIVAYDSGGYQDIKQISLNLVNKDEDKPVLYKKKIVEANNGNHVYLIFMDKTSYIKWWVIKVDWVVVKRFKWNYVDFIVKAKNVEISYEVEDWYKNKLEWVLKVN